MKVPVKSQSKASTKSPLRRATSSKLTPVSLRKKSPSFSRLTTTAKRRGKQTLRDILLSKTFHAGFKVFIGLLVSGSALYGAYAFIGNSVADDVIVSKSEIIARVSQHTELPAEEPEAVVRVQDAETLKKQALLYENVKEGDYIIVYPSLAVVYDLRNDRIVALKASNRR